MQLSSIVLYSRYFHNFSTFFNANDSFTSVGTPLFFDTLLGFLFISAYSTSVFSLHNAYSVRTVIDYVTVYRAHSSYNIRKKGVTPLSVLSLSMHHYSIYSRPVIQSPARRYPPPPLFVAFKISVCSVDEICAEVYALAFCAIFSAKCNFADAVAWIRTCAFMIVVARTRVVFASSGLRVWRYQIFTIFPSFQAHVV